MQSSTSRLLQAAHIGLLSVSGNDAERFLHAQLSRHVVGLPADLAPLAGWHDARGRLRALFRVLRTDNGFMLMTTADTVDAAIKGIQLYVLRSDVRLENAGTDWRVLAVTGDDLLPAQLIPGPGPGAVQRSGDLLAIRLAEALVHVAGPNDAIGRWLAEANLPAPQQDPAAEAAEIHAGLPAVPATLAGRFLPQMLNLDHLDALSFNKGCYPGQEVIARAQNLGQVKRRMARFALAQPQPQAQAQAQAQAQPPDINPGDEIVDASGQPVGDVVRAAHANDTTVLLAVVPVDHHDLALRASDGSRWPITPLAGTTAQTPDADPS